MAREREDAVRRCSPKVFIAANRLDALGGVQTATFNLAEELERQGHTVRFLGATGSHPGDPVRASKTTVIMAPHGWPQRIMALFIPKDLNAGMWWQRLRFLERRAAVKRLGRLLSLDKNAVVIAMDVFVAELVLKGRTGIPVVVQYHNSHEAIRNTRDYSRLRRMRPALSALVALTREDAHRFDEAGFGPTIAIGNSVPLTDRAIGARRKVVAFVGRYDAPKRLDLLLAAWSGICAEHPDWLLETHGAGPLRHWAVDSVRENDLSSSVSIGGLCVNVSDLLKSVEILALPSDYEGVPMILAEAMSCGAVCVATDCSPGVRNLLDHGRAGVLTDLRDAHKFGEALGYLMTDADRREQLRLAGYSVAHGLRPEAIVAKWLTLLRAVAS